MSEAKIIPFKPFQYHAWIVAKRKLIERIFKIVPAHLQPTIGIAIEEFFKGWITEYGNQYSQTVQETMYIEKMPELEKKNYMNHSRQAQIHQLAAKIFETGAYMESVEKDLIMTRRTYRLLVVNDNNRFGIDK